MVLPAGLESSTGCAKITHSFRTSLTPWFRAPHNAFVHQTASGKQAIYSQLPLSLTQTLSFLLCPPPSEGTTLVLSCSPESQQRALWATLTDGSSILNSVALVSTDALVNPPGSQDSPGILSVQTHSPLPWGFAGMKGKAFTVFSFR